MHSVRVEAEYDWPSDRIFSIAREFDVVGSHNRFALVRPSRCDDMPVHCGLHIMVKI